MVKLSLIIAFRIYNGDGSRDPFDTLKQALLRKVFE